jgi:hypothetical protein
MTPEPGLPEHILMDVIGSDDKITRLHLKENKRLNVNADIYEQDIDRATLRRLETNNKQVEVGINSCEVMFSFFLSTNVSFND